MLLAYSSVWYRGYRYYDKHHMRDPGILLIIPESTIPHEKRCQKWFPARFNISKENFESEENKFCTECGMAVAKVGDGRPLWLGRIPPHLYREPFFGQCGNYYYVTNKSGRVTFYQVVLAISVCLFYLFK